MYASKFKVDLINATEKTLIFTADDINYVIESEKYYGKSFRFVSARLDPENYHIIIELKQEREEVYCPFCQSNRKKVQKTEKRQITDLFEFEDVTEDDIKDYKNCVYIADVSYENITYKCKNPYCGKLYKNVTFIPSKRESPDKIRLSRRFISFLNSYSSDAALTVESAKEAKITKIAGIVSREFKMFLNFPLSASSVLRIIRQYPEENSVFLICGEETRV